MKSTTPVPSYDGQQVYVGIDVHKKSYVIVVRVQQTVVKKWSTTAHPEELAQQLLKYFCGATIHSVYEAGFSGFGLHRVLVNAGIDNIVVHAAAVEVAAHNRVKTDTRDAAKLSQQLEAGRLSAIRVPSEDQEHDRLLSRTRAQLVQERAAVKQQIRMKAHQFGLIEPEENREMSHAFVKALLTKAIDTTLKMVIEVHWSVWRALDEQIAKLVEQLKQQAQRDENEATYRSAPGVGPISARVLSNELGNMSEFTNERQLFRYTGLTPSEHSSGEQTHRGHITKQGNRHIRGLLLEIAWRAIRKDAALRSFFDRLQVSIGAKRAIIAVSRKLIGKIRAAFRKGEHYKIDYSSASVTAA